MLHVLCGAVPCLQVIVAARAGLQSTVFVLRLSVCVVLHVLCCAASVGHP